MIGLSLNNIGGGTVLRAFTRGTPEGMQHLKAGTKLTADELKAIPLANRQALVEKRFIEVWPAAPAQTSFGERHIIHRGGGQFDVIAGAKLNTKPLSKDEAEDLATKPD